MAIANSDGSIILSTKVDTSGLNKGMSQMQGKAAGLTKTFSKLGAAIASAFAIQKIIQFSNESASLATQTEASVQRLVDIYGEASDTVGDFIDQNAKAIGLSKSAGASIASTYGNLLSVWADQETNAELTNALLNQTAVVASKTGRTVEDVSERVRSGLLGNTEAIEDLGINVNIKTIEITDAFKRIADGRSWEQLTAYEQAQVRTLAILEQSTNKYGNQVTETSATIRNRFRAAYEDFQNSWGNIVNSVLLPVLQVLTQILDIATKGLNAISGIGGGILANAKKNTDTSKKTAKNIKQQEKNQIALNKAVKKTIAGFDELNILSKDTADGLGGSIGGGEISSITTPDTESVEGGISEVAAMIMGLGGFLMIVLGIILICFGHIGWGISFIIAGAASLAVTEAALSDEAGEEIRNKLNAIITITSLVLLVLGVILLFVPGAIGLALGLIFAGAVGLAAEVKIDKDATVNLVQKAFEKTKQWLTKYGGLVIGILLLFVPLGAPLGMALILDAVTAMGKGEKPMLWDSILDSIKTTWEKIKTYWNQNIADVWTLQFWLGLAKIAGNGLIEGFELAINGIIGMFEKMINWVADGLNGMSFSIPDWVPGLGGEKFGINIPRANFGRVSIPRLAQGTVVPPNKEFMAVLGDNTKEHEIVSPVSTIKQAVAEVLAQANIGGGFNGRIEVPVIIDGREVARAIRNAEGGMGRQTVTGGFANVY